MRTFIHLFLNLLIPLSILFIIASIGYFTYVYDFSKALKLGLLTGVIFGIGASLIISPVLLITGKVKNQDETDPEEYAEPELEPESAQKVKKETTTPQEKQVIGKKQVIGIGKEIKCMLIMDKELAYNLILNTPKNEMGCTVSQSDPEKGTISIQTNAGSIQATITSLTKHTSQVIVHAANNLKQAQTLVTLLKKKEYDFLDY